MRHYSVTAYTADGPVTFAAIAWHPVDAMSAAYDRFGAVSVTVRPA